MARAITTRYVGPTNNRAAYVCASEPEGKRVRVPEGPGLGYSEEQWHLQAAMLLCAKLNWSGELIGGGIKGGMVWVFVPKGKMLMDTAATIAGDM